MTDLIAMAKQAGLSPYTLSMEKKELQAFADLIRQDERETYIQLCAAIECRSILGAHPEYMAGKEMAVSQCISAIRARTTT